MKQSPKTSGAPSPSMSLRSTRTQCPYAHDAISVSSYATTLSAPPAPIGRQNGARGSNASIISIGSGRRVLPLTPKELYRMRTSWVAVHMKDAGLDTFFMMFKQHPHIIKYFERIQFEVGTRINDEKISQFRMNMVIQRHAARVLRLMDSMLFNIDNPAQLARLIDQAVHSHIALKCMRFEGQLFQSIVSPLVESMRRMLGARFNAHLESIYTRTFRFLVGELVRGFDALPEPPEEMMEDMETPVASGGSLGLGVMGCPFRGTSSPTPSPPGTPSGMPALPPSASSLALMLSPPMPLGNHHRSNEESEKLEGVEGEANQLLSPTSLSVPQGWRLPNNLAAKNSPNGGAEKKLSIGTMSSTASSTAATTSANTSPAPSSRNGTSQMSIWGTLKYEEQQDGKDQCGQLSLKCPFSRGKTFDASELEGDFGARGTGESRVGAGSRRAELTPLVREGSGDSGLQDRESDLDHQPQQLVDGVLALKLSCPSTPVCPFAAAK